MIITMSRDLTPTGILPSVKLGVEAPRLSTMSARQLAQGASTIALPVLGDLVEVELESSLVMALQ